MKIGIDARMFGTQQGGIGRYIEQLILNLEKQTSNTNLEFVIFLRKKNWDEYKPKNKNFKKVLADIPWYSLKEQICLPFIFKKEKLDLMHFPHWNIPILYNKKFIVTIHDLLLLHFPTRESSRLGIFSYFFKSLAYKFIIYRSAKKSRHIFTVSEFSKNDIHKTLNIPLGKITVTYPAPFIKNEEEINNTNILKKQNIKKPYILYVGNAYPHKNLKNLIKAWKLFNNKNYQLVLVGKKDFFYKKLIKNNKFQNIIFTDFIPDNELSELYKNAVLYIFPSLYEGFGIPPLEAMTYKTPVLSSNATVLPEILKDSAVYFNPKDPLDIAKTMKKVLDDENLQLNLIKKGQNLLNLYSWEKLTSLTLKTYLKTVDK